MSDARSISNDELPARRRGLRLDERLMNQRMDEALAIAQDPSQHAEPTFAVWAERIREFSALAGKAAGKQSIAVIGTQIIAKATDISINPFCLRASASVSGAYNARAPAEKVLYPASVKHGFDIGSHSANPLNGQTFNKLKVIDKSLRIRGGQTLVEPLNDILHAIGLLPTARDATIALAAYVFVRSTYVPTLTRPSGHIGITNASVLASAISEWVSSDSEGGARAQAAVGGVLDAVFGSHRVRVGKSNEPDRQVVGDVIVWDMSQDRLVDIAVEVRDKSVSAINCLSTIRKLQRASVRKGAIVAVSKNQAPVPREEFEKLAAELGILLDVYWEWQTLVRQAVFWGAQSESEGVRAIVDAIRNRAEEIHVTSAGVTDWDTRTRAPSQETGA
jgi:hypothetical protein